MEREETEEKESVRKTEKERHEMKYKVGDKVRVRKDLKVSKEYDGMIFNDVMSQHCGETVTINEVFSRGYYRIVEYGCCWTDGMFEGLADEELTAEEATKILSEICCENELCGGCPISEAKGKMTCQSFRRDKTEEVLEILKRWKKDHEKKEVEVEFACIVRVIEDTGFRRRCVYEEDITKVKDETFKMSMKRVLEEYCKEHEGEFFTVYEETCRVKE